MGTRAPPTSLRLVESHRKQPPGTLFDALLQNIEDAAFVVEPDTRRIRSCNPATERIFGYSADELVGRTTEMLHIDREHDRHFGAESGRALERQGVYRGRFSMRRRDGASFPTTCTVVSSRDSAGIEAVINIVRDDSDTSLSGQRNDLVGVVAERLWEASDMPGALRGVLDPLCRHFSWACGEAWARCDGGRVRRMACWAEPGSGLDRHLVGSARLPSGHDLVGRVWETERAVWVTGSGEHGGSSVDVTALGSLFAAPVSTGADEPLAVLVFGARQPQARDWRIQNTTEYVAGLAGPCLREFARRWAGRGSVARPPRETAASVPAGTNQELAAALQSLSRRERQVLDYLLQGRLTKEIAYELGLSPRTVETYRASLKRKMGARTTAEVITMLVVLGPGSDADDFGTGR